MKYVRALDEGMEGMGDMNATTEDGLDGYYIHTT